MSKTNDVKQCSPRSTEYPEADRCYWAAAIYKAIPIGVRRRRHLWERIVFLVQASDEAAVFQAAQCVALAKEHQYLSADGFTIKWTLQRVERVEALFDAKIHDGADEFWEYFERVDPLS